MKSKLVFLTRNYKGTGSAGYKARVDTETLLENLGYRNIGFSRSHNENKITDFFLNLGGILKALLVMPSNGTLFIQYPLKKYYALVCKVAHLKNTKVISLIHDLGTFRRKKLTVEKEIRRLNNSDYIIATNEVMAQWLKDNGAKAQISALGVWHYLSQSQNNSPLLTNPNHVYTVCYAGSINRRKNSFLYAYAAAHKNYNLEIYGGNLDAGEAKNTSSKGYVAGEDFIQHTSGDFGLVWDGDSMNECSSSFGEYLRYNTPHKVSFYIRSHLPVIVWNQAAMATFVQQNKIGITINSLSDINGILSALTVEEFNEMKSNAIALSKRLQTPFFLEKAIKSLAKI